jgi:hypothetical protein
VRWSISGMPDATISAGAGRRGEKGAGIMLPRDFSSWARKAEVFTGITVAKKDQEAILFSLFLRLVRILSPQPVLVNSRISMHCCLRCLSKYSCKCTLPCLYPVYGRVRRTGVSYRAIARRITVVFRRRIGGS